MQDISAKKNEPGVDARRTAQGAARSAETDAELGSNLDGIDFDNIKYFVRSTEKQATSLGRVAGGHQNTYDRLGISRSREAGLVAGVAAQYECLAGDTLVWTPTATRFRSKEITYGDRVFAYDESAERFVVAPVKASAQTDTRQTYTVATTRRSVRATGNHPMLVLRDERKPGRQRTRYARRWVTVGEIEPATSSLCRQIPEFGVAAELPSWRA